MYICTLFCIDVSAQFRFDSWTTDNGLPQVSVNSIIQSRDGFLWFTTYGGMVRYDGLRFQVFNTGNTKGLRTSRFLSLFEDSEGSLWTNTEGQGITRYKDGNFTTYTTENGLPDNQVHITGKDENGNVVVAANNRLVRWNGEGFSPYTPSGNEPVKNIVHQTKNGSYWYLNGSNLCKFENGRVTVDFAPGFQVKRVFEDSERRAWIAGDKDFLFMFKDGRLTTYSDKDGYAKHRYSGVFEDRQKRVWFGTPDGLVLFKDNKFTLYTTENGLTRGFVNSIYQDREGTLWVGTAGGLSRLTEQTVKTYSVKDGLAAENVYPIYEDRQGKIWIGSWFGLTVYENGQFQNVSERYEIAKREFISAFLEDREGNFWIGFWGAVARQGADGKIKIFSQAELPVLHARAIRQDRDGNIWIGNANGLIKLESPAADDSNLRTTFYTTKDGLSGKEVFVIHEDLEGGLWIGTDTGLTKYKDGSFEAFTEKNGIAGNIVRAIYEDSEGALWIGMYDSGLYRYKQGRFTHYTTNEGLFDSGAFQILEDNSESFWISCNLGIYRVRKSELNDLAEGRIQKVTSVLYNKRDGMLNSECNGGVQPAGIKARDGKLWFPTQQGVAVINPEAIPFNTQPPPVVIESLTIDTETVEARSPVKILPGQVYFEIHYSGLSFINPELVKFKYRLEGLDTDWVDAGTRRTAYYTHLPPGKYRFTVLAANRDGVWNEQGASVEITVLPPFWRTWWFLALAFFFVAAAAFAFYRRRIGILKRAHAAQEAFSRQLIESQETERSRISKELHDSLGQSLVLIKNWVLLELKGQDSPKPNLNQISETASEAIKEVREIAYNLGPYQLDRFGLSRTIEEMVRKVANSSPIRFNVKIDEIDGCLTKDAEINVFRILQEAVNNIVKHSGAHEANLSIELDTNRLMLTVCDDGKGFADQTSQNGKRGFGLLGMTERVNLLKGELVIESGAGKGTTIKINLPWENRK